MAMDSGPEAGLKAVVEDVKGKAKEAEAEKARAEASAHEAEKKAAQNS